MLTQDLIKDTSKFRLLLRVGPAGAHAVVFAPDADGSLISAALPYEEGRETLAALQDVIYDNPLILGEFADTIIVMEPQAVIPLPAELSSELRREIVGRQVDMTGKEVLEDATGLVGSVFEGVVAHDVMTFLRRTFPTATFTTHIGTLTRFFASRPGRANSSRMLAAFRRETVDVIALRDNRLLMANSFSFANPEDAVYYILACRSELGMSAENDDLQLTGDRSHRDIVTPELRRFVARVMPLIFPPELFKAGKDSLLAPFDLMISPLTF